MSWMTHWRLDHVQVCAPSINKSATDKIEVEEGSMTSQQSRCTALYECCTLLVSLFTKGTCRNNMLRCTSMKLLPQSTLCRSLPAKNYIYRCCTRLTSRKGFCQQCQIPLMLTQRLQQLQLDSTQRGHHSLWFLPGSSTSKFGCISPLCPQCPATCLSSLPSTSTMGCKLQQIT